MRRLKYGFALRLFFLFLSFLSMELVAVGGGMEHSYKIEEIRLPSPSAGPSIIGVDSSGAIWVSLAKAGKLAKVVSENEILEYQLPPNSFPVGLDIGTDGKIWYCDARRNTIATIDPSNGYVEEIQLPTQNAWPFFLRHDSRGHLWFTERAGNKIGEFNPQTRLITEYPLPVPFSQPAGLTVTSDDHVFWTENSNHVVGHIAPGTSEVHEYPVPSQLKKDPHYGLAGIHSDRLGNIWFSELDGRLGFLERRNGSYTPAMEYPIPDPAGRPGGIYVDSSNQVWFTELDGNRISKFDPTKSSFVSVQIPSGMPDPEPRTPPEMTARGQAPIEGKRAQSTRPFGIMGDAAGNIWFAEQYGHRLGRVFRTPTNEYRARKTAFAIRHVTEFVGAAASETSQEILLETGTKFTWKLPELTKDKQEVYTVYSEQASINIPCRTGSTHECGQMFNKAGEYPYSVLRGDKIFYSGKITVVERSAQVEEFLLPSEGRVPGVIESDINGNVWFTEIGGFSLPNLSHYPPGSHIGVIGKDNIIREYEIPTKGGAPTSLKISDKGMIWFTEQHGNKIGSFDPSLNTFREYTLPTNSAAPTGIAIDERRGFVWFTEKKASQIGYLQVSTGRITELKTPSEDSEPSTIAVDENGDVWFDERGSDKIARFHVETAEFTEFVLPKTGNRIVGVTPGKGGLVWFLELGGNKIGKLNVKTGLIAEYSLPSSPGVPFKLAIDNDGYIWFTQVFGNKIGRFRDGEFVEVPLATKDSMPGGIAIDREGNVWFTEQATNRIGVFRNAAAAKG